MYANGFMLQNGDCMEEFYRWREEKKQYLDYIASLEAEVKRLTAKLDETMTANSAPQRSYYQEGYYSNDYDSDEDYYQFSQAYNKRGTGLSPARESFAKTPQPVDNRRRNQNHNQNRNTNKRTNLSVRKFRVCFIEGPDVGLEGWKELFEQADEEVKRLTDQCTNQSYVLEILNARVHELTDNRMDIDGEPKPKIKSKLVPLRKKKQQNQQSKKTKQAEKKTKVKKSLVKLMKKVYYWVYEKDGGWGY
jgi:Skp family chaperone for outer membrane proteins